MERSWDNGEGYESHLQGFVGGDRDVVGGLSSKSKKREQAESQDFDVRGQTRILRSAMVGRERVARHLLNEAKI